MNKERMGTRRTTNGAVLEELARELKHLRGLLREAGENFILRREGEIEAIISNLDAVPPGKLRAEAPGLLHEIHSLKVKPEKGRLKDLKGLTELIEILEERVITAQDKGAGKE